MSLQQLPREIMSRVLFVVATTDGVGGVLNFLYTNRFFYCNYIEFVYITKPLTIATGGRHRGGGPRGIGRASLQRLLHNDQVCSRVYVVNVVCMNRFAPIDELVLTKMNKFVNLTVLTINTNNLRAMQYVLGCSSNLVKLIIILKYKLLNTQLYDLSRVSCSLKIFKVSSDKPLLNKTGLWKVGLRYSFQRPAMVRFGSLVYQFLDCFRNSLESVELDKIDLALAFNGSCNYHYPSLKLLLIDNISILNKHTWIADFQLANWRASQPCFIAIHDTTGEILLTKTTNTPPGSWSFMKNPVDSLAKVKNHLQLE